MWRSVFRRPNYQMLGLLLVVSAVPKSAVADSTMDKPLPPPIVEPARASWDDVTMTYTFPETHSVAHATFHRSANYSLAGLSVSLGTRTVEIPGKDLAFARHIEVGESFMALSGSDRHGYLSVYLPYSNDFDSRCQSKKLVLININEKGTYKVQPEELP